MPAPAKSHCKGDKATGKSCLVDGELASEETITIKQQAEGCGGWKKTLLLQKFCIPRKVRGPVR